MLHGRVPPVKRVVLAGGSGTLGQVLAAHFRAQGWDPVVLARSPKPGEAGWDGESLGAWAARLDGAEVVINLCGRSVDCRYTAANRKILIDSRVKPTRVIGEAIARCANPPRLWMNASSATLYRHTYGPAWDESAANFGPEPEAKDAFSLDIIHAWEKAFYDAPAGSTRRVALRAAMVLGHGANSVLPVLCRLARLGLGGRMSHGRQFVSWIHEGDFARSIDWLIAHPELAGPVNLAAPNPLTNADMMRIIRKVVGAPFGLPAERWMLEIGAFFLRTETELIVKSRRVIPGKLLASGFKFQFPGFEPAVRDLLRA
ncbi:MAG: DUF1731 domain-containing protein [Acidobacteria bacterium]|nr:DUF1731 domain-containing protein [Acidobacteriota bacterium]